MQNIHEEERSATEDERNQRNDPAERYCRYFTETIVPAAGNPHTFRPMIGRGSTACASIPLALSQSCVKLRAKQKELPHAVLGIWKIPAVHVHGHVYEQWPLRQRSWDIILLGLHRPASTRRNNNGLLRGLVRRFNKYRQAREATRIGHSRKLEVVSWTLL